MVVIGSQHGESPVDLSGHDRPDDDVDEQEPDVDLSGLENLLRRGEESEVPATQAAAKKVRAAVEDLQQRVETEAAEKRVLDEIAELEEQLAARRAKLKEIRPGKSTTRRPAGDGPTPKEVRAWAAERGIECSPIGRVPQAIVDQYLAAKAGA
nr:histone-like nucleoid-structuring protein Lsr2 [Actinoallomurus iriomotensis]